MKVQKFLNMQNESKASLLRTLKKTLNILKTIHALQVTMKTNIALNLQSVH